MNFFNNIRARFLKVTFVTGICLFGLTSCENLLDLAPQDALSSLTIYTDAEAIEAAAAGLYNAAQSGFYDPLNGGALAVRGYPFGGFYVEGGDARGGDVINTAGFFGIIGTNAQNSNSPNTVNYWANLYALINQSNVFSEGVAGSTVISETVKNGYIAEARFLRAISHFELLVHYARPYDETPDASHLGVPYRDFAINSPSTIAAAQALGRDDVATCYTKMLADLDFAEANLPASRSGILNVTRPTSRVAIAFKVRARMHQRNYSAAITEANKLVPAGTDSDLIADGSSSASLSSTLSGIYSESASNTELLFAIESNSTDNAGVNGAIGTFYTGNGGRALLAVSPNFWNTFSSWRCDDLRRAQLYSLQAGPGFSAVLTTKYPDFTNLSDWTPVIRFAEVILFAAEAEARAAGLSSAPSARALAELNAVRNRSLSDASTQAYVIGDFTNNEELVQAILDERRIEGLCEGWRWRDIHRLGKAGFEGDEDFGVVGIPAKNVNTQTVAANYTFFDCGDPQTPITQSQVAVAYDDFRFIWGIPLSEVQNNPGLAGQQNGGY